MNLVPWLQSLLPSGPFAISGWVIFLVVISWAVLGLLAIAACVRSSQNSRWLRRAERAEDRLAIALWWQQRNADSPGPAVTAKTLTDDDV